jgi:RNA polymerase sigma factor (sigma-70 family)
VDEDDAILLAAAANGHQPSWNALVDRYTGLLWSIARGFRLDTADCADIIQNTWLHLVESLDRISDPERLVGWLATTARRECLQLLRRRSRAVIEGGDILDDLVDPAEPVDARILLTERDAALWRTLDALSDHCRRLLRLLMVTPPPRYVEVAAAMGVPIGSIGPQRQRCLAALRELADPTLDEDTP